MFGPIVHSRIVAFAGALALLLPIGAAAQDLPSYARPPGTIGTDETIHGRIRSVDGAFRISVEDDRGFVDTVGLHPGTIINPTGLTLSAGMSVTILGVNAGSAFDANEIDTPYTYAGPLPVPTYYGPGYWCPGFGYGYGPSFNLAIVIGGYRPWAYVQRPFYGRPWNGHGYFGGYVGVGPLAQGHADLHVQAQTHVPPAFAGRTFAGESRSAYTGAAPAEHFSDLETGHTAPSASAAVRSTPASTRGGGSNRGSHASSGGHGGGHAH
jgi:hypothetical protein